MKGITCHIQKIHALFQYRWSPVAIYHLVALWLTCRTVWEFYTGLYFVYFRLFVKKSLQFLQQINVKKFPSTIWYWDKNPQPSGCEPPPITTRPVANDLQSYKLYMIVNYESGVVLTRKLPRIRLVINNRGGLLDWYQAVWLVKSSQMSVKVGQNDFTRKMKDDTYTKFA